VEERCGRQDFIITEVVQFVVEFAFEIEMPGMRGEAWLEEL
jgi:hypothetical protein